MRSPRENDPPLDNGLSHGQEASAGHPVLGSREGAESGVGTEGWAGPGGATVSDLFTGGDPQN